jgi:hypothetical protein
MAQLFEKASFNERIKAQEVLQLGLIKTRL